LLLAAVYLIRTPKLYRSHLGLEVEFQDASGVTGDEVSARMRSAFLASQETLRTIEQSLTSATLLARVIRAEGFADDGGKALLGHSILADSEGRPPREPSPAARQAATPGSTAAAQAFTPIEQALAAELSLRVKTQIRRGTRLIDVFVTNRDPLVAQRLAEAIGREYVRSAVERRSGSSDETLRYLMEEEERLKRNLQKSEAAVAEYKAKTPDALQLGGGAASTGSQTAAGTATRGGLVEDKLQELSTRLNTVRAERMRLEREVQQVEAAGSDIDTLLAVPGVANAPAVTERRRELAQVQAAVGTLAQRYKDKHPKMMGARAALAEAQRSLQQAVLSQPAVLANGLDQARSAEESAQTALAQQEKAALALNKASIGFQELARQAETDRALYESVLRQIKSTDVTKGVKATPVAVVERAVVPTRPVSPRPLIAIAVALFAGTAGGLGLIFGLDALDRSIKTVDEAETVLGLPTLAAVPDFRAGEAKNTTDVAATEDDAAAYRLVAQAPDGPAAEAFRSLRATVALLGPESSRKISLFTSAAPGEGKSFTSANYALSLAQQGHRVLLIDGDLRRPSLHKIFTRISAPGTAATAETLPGIVDCLVGNASLEEAVRHVSNSDIGTSTDRSATGGRLAVLTGERRAPNPAELLGANRFAELIAQASQSFDRVVVDSAPVLAVSDTLLMAPHIQIVCMVVRAGKTPRGAAQRAIALIASAGRQPVGVVLNRLPKGRGDGYYYYSSPGYGDGIYGGSYGVSDAASQTPSQKNGLLQRSGEPSSDRGR
jgi:capsular exopolysaccharide synthesis family protein